MIPLAFGFGGPYEAYPRLGVVVPAFLVELSFCRVLASLQEKPLRIQESHTR